MNHKYIFKISEWLDNSPSKKVIVAFCSILAFIISSANMVWEIAKESETVEIAISGRTNYNNYAPVSMEQLLGLFDGENRGKSPKIMMPYFPIDLEVSNPTGHNSTLVRCKLFVGFYERQEEFESTSYLTQEALTKRPYKKNPYINIGSGKVEKTKLLFFFIPDPKLTSMLKDKTTQAHRFRVGCNNESGKYIES